MFTVALLQNQSEMAHYGYADARPLLKDLGYQPYLYTADNIESLGSALVRNQYDAVVFGSNALNDKTIRAEVISSSFQTEFREWLSNGAGRGCLCLHQLRLATLEDSTLRFLPEPLNSLKAKVRPPTEKSAHGEIALGSKAGDHPLLLYPHRIDPEGVRRNAVNFRSLPGFYWHSWSNVNLEHWEVLLVDPCAPEDPRPLVLSAREPRDSRVVVSALTLDWQKQRHFLQNLLTYAVEGRHNTAVLADQDSRSTAFEYFIGTLQSRKYPFRKYFLGQELRALEQHLIDGVHAALVIGPFVALSRLPSSLSKVISDRVVSGYLKLVTIESPEPEARRFSVAGRERSALRWLNTAELQIQAELREGYVDGSFWSTAETLQILQTLPQSTSSYKHLVDQALKLASEHDRDGSYDEVFGVTCAFLWMRGTYLGVEAQGTVETTKWIRARIPNYENREQVQAYLTLSELGIITDVERQELGSLLADLQTTQLSEIDIAVYLRAALASNHLSVIPGLASALEEKQNMGAWIDLATTATTVAVLIDTLAALRSDPAAYGRLKPTIEQMLFAGIIHIQEDFQRSLASDQTQKYPWDGKASTTCKCIQAWLKFEDLIDLPVHELVETLTGYDIYSTSLSSGSQALSVLEDLKEENSNLRSETAKLDTFLSKTRDVARKNKLLLFMLCITLYILVTIMGGLGKQGGLKQVTEILKIGFADAWAVHLGVVGTAAAVLSAVAAAVMFPWSKVVAWRKRWKTR